ncbi:PEP-CTERM-box response regulator transcription factor [Neptunomonas phycophila]|uniref:PEP-CTERM-box response regulator transcription factor n=2 Tax=Neptunomonas phycophila TaxID=1572645 RepID=A0AAW7XK22_9GAMM|nr:PEP-CTERM-box response regulator transcription factor [Neptunomonas phycophila]MBT3144242.1 PEP-CTERM-box response regulator transcription factor [Neptunomonas phycophila]MDO6454465.1 PEP-CTERM-box response regulator transcription factor [Neptunomonas phycophila]MDO6782580.1 PEP-CTERM-box response regulator transcription factor [Neptunomonas phycophila]MDP2521935.1 PEP-CTERM-box response regulator transcription factor [Neptunomonas phycophila]
MNGISKNLLIVEDDEGLQSQLRWCFDDFEVSIAGTREEAITHLRRNEPGVVLLDLGLPPDPGGTTEGFATLQEILRLTPETKVIVITGDNDRANAVKAIALGAYDFYQKPADPEILKLIVNRAYQVFELELENKRLQLNSHQSMPLDGIIANSASMLKACRTIEKIAPSDISTLLLGASGTGKELFAQAIHNLSNRSNKKLVAINCAAIPENLLESELFGYEKGAFTGAVKQTIGKFEMADGGTIFLDEIGDLPYELQAKLLRFLQERVIERVGGRKEIPIDARIICATHQNLAEHIKEGRFREDLFYRISEITINIPAVREREGDALLIAKAFLTRFNQEYGKSLRGFSPEAIQAIESYDWPGNVRELESKIKRAVIMTDGLLVESDDLDIDDTDSPDTPPLNLKQIREEAERKAILRALQHANQSISDTAKLLGITRPTLYSMFEKYDIHPKNQ